MAQTHMNITLNRINNASQLYYTLPREHVYCMQLTCFILKKILIDVYKPLDLIFRYIFIHGMSLE